MSMRAMAVVDAFGIDHLRCVSRDVPRPGHGEVLLRLKAASLNRRDLLLVEGVYNPRQPLPVVPCSDGAGIVEALGESVEDIAVGDRVVLHFFTGWISGEPDTHKLGTALGGPGGDGTLRDFIVVPRSAVLPIPAAMDFADAATLPCAALTAWSAIAELGATKPGDTVVIQGTGGVSLFALQFAKMLGARVIATSSSDERMARLTALGADAVINYRETPDWGARARKIADGRIDLIVEVGGADTLDQSLRAIRPGGTIALIGVLSGAKAAVTLTLAVMRQVRLQGVTCGSAESFAAMLRAIAQNGLDPVIDKRFALEDAQVAFRHMAANAHVGKIVVEI